MTPTQFLTFANMLPEALLMVASDGNIMAVNRPAMKLLGKPSAELTDRSLSEFVKDSPQKVANYLQTCAQSRQMILGAISIDAGSGQALSCRSKGAVMQPRSQSSPAIIMLRLEKQESSRFVVLNQKINELSRENQRRQRAQAELAESNEALRDTLLQLQNALNAVQTEKMTGLSKMVAGIAHEINNPVSFIYGNLRHAEEYCHDLLDIIGCYQKAYPQPTPNVQAKIDEVDLDFLEKDLQKVLNSMRTGSERVSEIVKLLRNFSRLDESGFKMVDIHEGLEATLMILQSRLNPHGDRTEVEVIKQYDKLPLVYCSPGLINQVFINLLTNAIDALEDEKAKNNLQNNLLKPVVTEPNRIWISTEQPTDSQITICIKDNGSGIPSHILHKIFDPFFTTKAVGKGTGLGLSMSYQVIKSHGGQLEATAEPGLETKFTITLPISKPIPE